MLYASNMAEMGQCTVIMPGILLHLLMGLRRRQCATAACTAALALCGRLEQAAHRLVGSGENTLCAVSSWGDRDSGSHKVQHDLHSNWIQNQDFEVTKCGTIEKLNAFVLGGGHPFQIC